MFFRRKTENFIWTEPMKNIIPQFLDINSFFIFAILILHYLVNTKILEWLKTNQLRPKCFAIVLFSI